MKIFFFFNRFNTWSNGMNRNWSILNGFSTFFFNSYTQGVTYKVSVRWERISEKQKKKRWNGIPNCAILIITIIIIIIIMVAVFDRETVDVVLVETILRLTIHTFVWNLIYAPLYCHSEGVCESNSIELSVFSL